MRVLLAKNRMRCLNNYWQLNKLVPPEFKNGAWHCILRQTRHRLNNWINQERNLSVAGIILLTKDENQIEGLPIIKTNKY